jgi:hypothetical protein
VPAKRDHAGAQLGQDLTAYHQSASNLRRRYAIRQRRSSDLVQGPRSATAWIRSSANHDTAITAI